MKKIVMVFFSLCLLWSYSVPCFASEITDGRTSSEVTFSAEVPAVHTLTILAEHAVVSYKGTAGTSFEAPRLTEFTLKISAEKGYRIRQILLDGTDVTAAYADSALTLSGIYEQAELTIVTEEAPVIPGSNSPHNGASQQTGDSSSQSVSKSLRTGDNSTIALWTILILFIGGGIAEMVVRGKKKKAL